MSAKGFGKPKYGGGGFGNQRKPKEGDNIIRVLPPMHSFADAGKWTNYVGLHFGVEGVDPKDSTQTKQRPFRCIQDKQRNGIITQACPMCDKIAAVEAEMAELEQSLIRDSKPADEIETAQAPMAAWLKAHNVDRKHYLNVIYDDGEMGWFTLSHRTKSKHLDVKIDEVRETYGFDPLDIDGGCWFNIKRTGKKLDTVETCEVVMEDVTVGDRKLKDIKRAPLTEEQCTKALNECKDLASVGTLLTFDQIAAIANSSGDPEEIDAIFAQTETKSEAKTSAPATKTVAKQPEAVAAPATPKTAPVAETKAPATTPAAKSVDPGVAQRLAQIAAKKAAEAAAEAARVKAEQEAAAAAAAAPEVPAEELSDEEFLKKFGG